MIPDFKHKYLSPIIVILETFLNVKMLWQVERAGTCGCVLLSMRGWLQCPLTNWLTDWRRRNYFCEKSEFYKHSSAVRILHWFLERKVYWLNNWIPAAALLQDYSAVSTADLEQKANLKMSFEKGQNIICFL